MQLTRSANFPFSCKPEFYETVIKQTADKMGLSVSEFLRLGAETLKAQHEASQNAAPTQNENR